MLFGSELDETPILGRNLVVCFVALFLRVLLCESVEIGSRIFRLLAEFDCRCRHVSSGQARLMAYFDTRYLDNNAPSRTELSAVRSGLRANSHRRCWRDSVANNPYRYRVVYLSIHNVSCRIVSTSSRAHFGRNRRIAADNYGKRFTQEIMERTG
jgi:hypothetical protein